MAFERLKQRFSAPTRGEKINDLQQRVDVLSARQDEIHKDTPALERKADELLEQGKSSKSKIVQRRLASQLAQLRRDLQRQHITATMIGGQIDILSTDIHNLTLLQQGELAGLSDSHEITKNAVKAEEILESLSSDVALASTLEPGRELASQEELDILEEFEETEEEETETTELEVIVKPESQAEPLPKFRERETGGD